MFGLDFDKQDSTNNISIRKLGSKLNATNNISIKNLGSNLNVVLLFSRNQGSKDMSFSQENVNALARTQIDADFQRPLVW